MPQHFSADALLISSVTHLDRKESAAAFFKHQVAATYIENVNWITGKTSPTPTMVKGKKDLYLPQNLSRSAILSKDFRMLPRAMFNVTRQTAGADDILARVSARVLCDDVVEDWKVKISTYPPYWRVPFLHFPSAYSINSSA